MGSCLFFQELAGFVACFDFIEGKLFRNLQDVRGVLPLAEGWVQILSRETIGGLPVVRLVLRICLDKSGVPCQLVEFLATAIEYFFKKTLQWAAVGWFNGRTGWRGHSVFDEHLESEKMWKAWLKPCRTWCWPALLAKDTCARLGQCFLVVNIILVVFFSWMFWYRDGSS